MKILLEQFCIPHAAPSKSVDHLINLNQRLIHIFFSVGGKKGRGWGWRGGNFSKIWVNVNSLKIKFRRGKVCGKKIPCNGKFREDKNGWENNLKKRVGRERNSR